MDYVIRRRNKGVIKPLKINCNRGGLTMLEDEEDTMEPLSPSSAAFHTPDFNVHVLAIMGIKNSIDVDVFKAKFPTALLNHPHFSSVVEGDPSKGEELKWVRCKVELDKHIIVPKINLENIESSADKFLEKYLYELSKTSLDKSKPLWEVHILDLELNDGVKGIALFRIHHSLGDGTSLISLMLASTRQTCNPEALPTIPTQKKTTSHYHNNNNICFLWRWILALWMMLQLFWNTFKDMLLFVATVFFLKDKSPLKNSPRGASAPRRIVYRILSLDDMKLVKNAMNCTINDVALGITQAGLSQHLSRKYGINGNSTSCDSRKDGWKNFIKQIRLRSLLIINLRPTPGIQVLSDMMEKDTNSKWGNSFGYALLPFTIGLRDDPLDYIREAKAIVDKKKNSYEKFYTHAIGEIAMKLLGTKIASSIIDRVMTHTTIGFSNLVGPLEDISLCDHPIAYLAPTSYGQPFEVMINFQGFVNKMMLVMAIDEVVVPDPHQLCDDIIESLKIVKDAVITQQGSDPLRGT